MEILSFMLGVSAVLIILGVVFMFGMNQKIKKNSEEIKRTYDITLDIWKQIDEVERRKQSDIQEIYRTIKNVEHNYVSTIDSRLDKLENKLKTKTSKEVL